MFDSWNMENKTLTSNKKTSTTENMPKKWEPELTDKHWAKLYDEKQKDWVDFMYQRSWETLLDHEEACKIIDTKQNNLLAIQTTVLTSLIGGFSFLLVSDIKQLQLLFFPTLITILYLCAIIYFLSFQGIKPRGVFGKGYEPQGLLTPKFIDRSFAEMKVGLTIGLQSKIDWNWKISQEKAKAYTLSLKLFFLTPIIFFAVLGTLFFI